MASIKSLPELLDTLTSSLTSLSSSLPSEETLASQKGSFPILTTKNELLLTYLQNVVFLILLKIRHATSEAHTDAETTTGTSTQRPVFDETVRRLVELRVYLEDGVSPLEKKAQQYLQRMVLAAEHYEERTSRQRVGNGNGVARKKPGGRKSATLGSSDEGSDSISESDPGSESGLDSGSDSDADSQRVSAPLRNSAVQSNIMPIPNKAGIHSNSNSVYKAPRIRPVAPPSTAGPTRQPERPRTHRIMDEYVSNELSGAPTSEPSIGANILERGRRDVMSEREQKVADERQRYEEENLVRLPGAGKKDRQRLEREREKRDQFGGEEWAGLGGSADRILQVTKRSRSTAGALERSRKRDRDDGAGDGRNGGGGIGAAFEKKRRLLEKRAAGKRK